MRHVPIHWAAFAILFLASGCGTVKSHFYATGEQVVPANIESDQTPRKRIDRQLFPPLPERREEDGRAHLTIGEFEVF